MSGAWTVGRPSVAAARLVPLLPSLAVLLVSVPALAGPNAYSNLPLHAIDTQLGSCDIGDPCDPGPPTTEVEAGMMVTVYLMVRPYEDLVGVQTAFEWPADWSLLVGFWWCLPGQVTSRVPNDAGGPEAGTLTTAFDAITGYESAVIGYMFMLTGAAGCLDQVDSAAEGGSHFVSGAGEIDPIDHWLQAGTVCVNQVGEDACTGVPQPRLVCCRHNGGCDGDWRNCDDGYVNQGECWTCLWYGACCHMDADCEYVEYNGCLQGDDVFHAGRSCDEVECVTPVEQTSWGRIKALHRE